MMTLSTFLESLNKHKLEIFEALLETLDMMFSTLLFCIIIGLPLGVLLIKTARSKKKSSRFLFFLASTLINIFRSVPFMIFIIIMMPITKLIVGQTYGTDASKVPLAIVGVAIFARFTEQSIKSLPNEVDQLADALGATYMQRVLKFYLVEALPSLILGLSSTMISMLSYSTIMGAISGGGIGDMALRYALVDYQFSMMLIATIIMIILVQFIQLVGYLLSHIYDKKNKHTERGLKH